VPSRQDVHQRGFARIFQSNQNHFQVFTVKGIEKFLEQVAHIGWTYKMVGLFYCGVERRGVGLCSDLDEDGEEEEPYL